MPEETVFNDPSANMGTINLGNISPDGNVPETRLSDPVLVRQMLDMLQRASEKRNRVNMKVQGLIDGNPPYDPAELVKTGQAWRSNVNYREAEAFLDTAKGALYDILTEAPTYAECRVPDDELASDDAMKFSEIITREFDRFNKADKRLDFMFQLSQNDTIGFGVGPVVWDDMFDFNARYVPYYNLILPDETPSDINEWTLAVVLVEYEPSQLFNFIRDKAAATKAGWNIEATRQAIISAFPQRWRDSQFGRDWLWIQRRLRDNDLVFDAECSKTRLAFIYYKEFPKGEDKVGKISQLVMVSNPGQAGVRDAFLYRKIRKYERWQELINPMYFDKGNGTHYSVKGMGVKFFGALEQKNRLKNAVVDAAFARMSIMVQPNTDDGLNQLSVIQMGPFHVIPPGVNMLGQHNLSGVLDAPMAVEENLLRTVTANLAQYRQDLDRKQGNPITAEEARIRAQNQSSMNKTALNRYYVQLDDFWEERYRRLVASQTQANKGGREALEFQKRLQRLGVPSDIFRMAKAKSTRVVGQGNAFLRLAALQEMLAVSGILPENGRENLVHDFVAAKVGQDMVDRYLPPRELRNLPTDDTWEANIENAVMREGQLPVWTPQQNNTVHLQSHLQAASQALGLLQQGAQPLEVLQFVELEGQHSAQHLEALRIDPTRQDIYEMLLEQFEEIGRQTDMLREQAQQMAQAQAEQHAEMQAQQQSVATTEQLKTAQTMADIERKNAESANSERRKDSKLRQQLAAKDIQLREKIILDRAATAAKIQNDNAKQRAMRPKNGATT